MSGRRAHMGLRKLHPPSRAATPRGVARERRLRTETVPPPVNAMSPDQGRGRRVAGLRRPTRGVKGRIGAGSLLQGARVARIAECRLEQKVGYDRHTDHLHWYTAQIPLNITHGNLGYKEGSDPKIFQVLWEMLKGLSARAFDCVQQ